MRKFRRLFAASLLTLTLTYTALAGEIQLPGIAPPPPDQQQSSATGDVQFPGAMVAGQMDIPLVAETALTLMVNVLSVF